MALTPIFWTRVLEKHGSRGLIIALILAFVVSIILYALFYYLIPSFFDLPDMVEVFAGYLIMIIGLVIFFLLYWKLVVKKS